MKSLRPYWLLAFVACAVLSFAAAWLGGLNQDEGWYLYAANLVREGRLLYRDFFFTQGPGMPRFYAMFAWIWVNGGLLGARLFTLALGLFGIVFAALTARRLAPEGRGNAAALVVAFLLACNLYHLYYLTIPKAYALAALYVTMGFYLLTRAVDEKTSWQTVLAALAGFSLALSAGTRISLGALLAVTGFALLLTRRWKALAGFCVGGFGGLAFAYGPYLLDAGARAGLIAAQQYHAARGGFDPVWVVGSLSRLVRWYLPLFIVLGLGVAGGIFGGRQEGVRTERFVLNVLLWGFLAVFAVQMLAPFPYEDYQVPVMAPLAVYATVTLVSAVHSDIRQPSLSSVLLLVFGLSYATAFGSPLLERWMTNGQDRFWSLKKEKCELAQLRDVAKRIEALDPGGRTLLTQDLYLAIETNRKVPKGLEMGPFAILTDDEWRALLTVTAPTDCRIAALSAYTFAIDPPVCAERPIARQVEYWNLLKKNYEMVGREEAFGQGATPLLILKRR